MLQEETSIAAKLVHNLPFTYRVDGRSLGKHLATTYGSHHVLSAWVDSQLTHKMLNFGGTLSAQEI